jgi:hypothetical protein
MQRALAVLRRATTAVLDIQWSGLTPLFPFAATECRALFAGRTPNGSSSLSGVGRGSPPPRFRVVDNSQQLTRCPDELEREREGGVDLGVTTFVPHLDATLGWVRCLRCLSSLASLALVSVMQFASGCPIAGQRMLCGEESTGSTRSAYHSTMLV